MSELIGWILGFAVIAAVGMFLLQRKNPAKADKVVDAAGDAIDATEDAAKGAWARFQAWRARRKSGESKP